MKTNNDNVRNTITLTSIERAAEMERLRRQLDRVSYEIIDAEETESAEYVDWLCATRDALEAELEAAR